MQVLKLRGAVTGALLVLCTGGNGPAQAQTTSEVLVGRALPDNVRDFCYDVNEPWVAANPLPPSRPWQSEFSEYYDVVTGRVRDIISGPDAPPTVTRFVHSFTNVSLRNSLALRPLQPELEAIAGMRTPADIARLVARFNRLHRDLAAGVRFPAPAPFFTEVWPDVNAPRRQVMQLLQGGIGLPDRSYYLTQEPSLVALRGKYRDHIQRTLMRAGDADAGASAAAALEIETAIAGYQNDFVQNQNGEAYSRQYNLKQLKELAPAFDWPAFFREYGLPASTSLIVPQATFIRDVTELMAKQSTQKLQAYFRWQLLRRYAPFLGTDYTNDAFDFFNRTLQGVKEQTPVDALAIEYAALYLEDELAKPYVARYVPKTRKAKAQALAENVRGAYEERIRTARWLSESTRKEALRKLETLRLGMLYPEHPEQRPEVSLNDGELIGNLMKLSERKHAIALARLRRPTDRDAWWDSVTNVNGSYSASRNSLTIADARALPPLFDPEGDEAANYGGMGSLIAHEMGHALDNQGNQYDADGNLRNWWTDEDHKQFEQRTSRLIAQYEKYEPLPGMHLDGKVELSENIADLAGLAIAYEALKRARAAQSRPLTREDENKFFEAWARRWRVQYAQPFLVRLLKADSHPPLQYRCTLPLSNFTPFYEAVGIDPKSPAFVAPADRISIW